MRRAGVAVAGLFGLVLAVYLLGYRGVTAGDDLINVQASDHLVTRGELGFTTAEYDPAKVPIVRFFFRKGESGEVYSALPPGLPVASAPFCLAARWLCGAERPGSAALAYRIAGPGADRKTDPDVLFDRLRADPLAFAAGLVNPIAMAVVVACFFAFGIVEGADRRWALTVALVLGFGTMVWVYAETYWTQPLSLAALFAGFLALRVHALPDRGPLLGLAGGLLVGGAMLFRYDASAFGAVLLVAGCLAALRSKGIRAVVLPVVGFAVPVAVLAWWNWHRFGNPFQTGNPHGNLGGFLGAGVLGRLLVSLPANTVSFNQGLFVFAPPVAVGVWIAIRAWRRLDFFERTAVLFGAALVLFYSVFAFWETTGSWGPRFLVLVVAFLLLPALRHGSGSARRWLVGAGAVGVLVQVAGVLMPPIDSVTKATMLYFVRSVPRFLVRSEIWLDWRHVLVHGPHGFWWTGSVTGAVVGVVVLAAGVASGWIVWRAVGGRGRRDAHDAHDAPMLA